MQIYLAIRNRGYTNQVRLRGLKEFEPTEVGKVSYSREFYETVGELIGSLTHQSKSILISLISVRLNAL